MTITGPSGEKIFLPTGGYGTIEIKPNTFLFDGHEFIGGNWGSMPAEWASIFDLAYRARRGDESAIAVIQAANIRLTDINGEVYISRELVAKNDPPASA